MNSGWPSNYPSSDIDCGSLRIELMHISVISLAANIQACHLGCKMASHRLLKSFKIL